MLNKRTYLLAGVFIIIAIAARFLSKMGFFSMPLDLLRGGIYLFLVLFWGVSVYARVIHTQIRNYLLAVSGLLAFWMLIRTIKFCFAVSPASLRFLWYLYYLPMLFVPLCAVFISILLGKGEHYRLKRRKWCLILPTVFLLIMVLTNDRHQWVFRFPGGSVWSDADYSYGAAYFFVFGYIILCSFAALGIMIKKCRIPQEHKWIRLPFVPLAITVIYSILYISGAQWLRLIAGDMTVFECMTFIASFESCMICRLIQTNVGYEEMFQLCTLEMWVTDHKYETWMKSECCDRRPREISKEIMRQSLRKPQLLMKGYRLCGASLGELNIFWIEDVKALLDTAHELQTVKDNLEGENAIIQEEYRIAQKRAKIKEQQDIYRAMQRETNSQIQKMSELLENAKEEKDLKKAAVLGAYLKRRNNLLLNTAQSAWLKPEEFLFTFRDTKDNLELYGISCIIYSELRSPVFGETLKKMYDFFETVIEYALEEMSAVLVHAWEKERELRFEIRCDAKMDFYTFASGQAAVQWEDDEWRLEVKFPKEDIAC